MKRWFLLVSVVLLMALSGCNLNAPSKLLDDLAGTPVIAGKPLNTFYYYGNVQVEKVAVTGQTFTQAWRFTTTGGFTSPFEAQLQAQNTASIIKDDVLLVRFWARAIGTSNSGRTEFALEEGEPYYGKSVLAGVSFAQDWKMFQVPFLAHRDFAPGEATATFRLGYNNQSFELGGLQIVNFAKTRTVNSIPSRGFEYPGIEPDAPWRAAANARIDQYRKGNLNINVIDASGNPISGATVKVEMQKHTFGFGSAVATPPFLNNATYRNNVYKLFNRVVLESELKWVPWSSYSEQEALTTINMLRQNGISVRGHTLVWPLNNSDVNPPDVLNLTDANLLKSRINAHLTDIMGKTQGQLVDWDVVNEASDNKHFQNILSPNNEILPIVEWFNVAKALDPNVKLFINDYGNLGEGDNQEDYKSIIQRALAGGAPIEGIGFQGHFSWQLTPPEELYSRLSQFGQIVPNLAITEFDVNISDEKLQAAYLRDAMTIAFSHPRVNSFLMWGFWEGQHWQPQAALYRLDWSKKPNALVWEDLVLKQWRTNLTGLSNASGGYSVRGFVGQYKITVSKNGKSVSRIVTLRRTGNSFSFTL